jgi:hypothetical protein
MQCACPILSLWPPPPQNTFPYYLINGTIVASKNIIDINYVFRFSVQLLSEIFFILRRMERDMVKNVCWCSREVPLFMSDFNESWIFSTVFRNIFKYQISRKSVQWEPSCSTRTDAHDVANSCFSQIWNVPQLINYRTTSHTTNSTRTIGWKTLIHADIGACALHPAVTGHVRHFDEVSVTRFCRADNQHILDVHNEVQHAVCACRHCEAHTRVLWVCKNTLFSLECRCKMFCLVSDVSTALLMRITVQITTNTAKYRLVDRLHI